MKIRTLLTILLSISYVSTYAQNDKANRESFTLKLPVDGKNYYEQKIDESPYFVKDMVLQIFPGENFFIEVEAKRKKIKTMKVVKENLNPEKTIEINFSQETKDKKNEMMILKVKNPFKYKLEYNAMMYIVGHDKWINTSIVPVQEKLTGIEMWNDVIISLVLSEWKLK